MAVNPKHSLNLVGLNIAQHNIRSLKANKIQIINFLDKYNVHVYLTSEIWLKKDDDFFFEEI